MRAAPLPPEIALLELWFTTGSRSWRVQHHLFLSGAGLATAGWAQELLQLAGLYVMPIYLDRMSNATIQRAGRLYASGIPYTYQYPAVPGTHGQGEALGTVLTLKWTCLDVRFSQRALTHVSSVPSSYIADETLLNGAGTSAWNDGAVEIITGLNTLPAPDQTPCVFVAVRQRTKTGPLPATLQEPVAYGSVSPSVSTMRRRLPARRSVPPGFGPTLP